MQFSYRIHCIIFFKTLNARKEYVYTATGSLKYVNLSSKEQSKRPVYCWCFPFFCLPYTSFIIFDLFHSCWLHCCVCHSYVLTLNSLISIHKNPKQSISHTTFRSLNWGSSYGMVFFRAYVEQCTLNSGMVQIVWTKFVWLFYLFEIKIILCIYNQ